MTLQEHKWDLWLKSYTYLVYIIDFVDLRVPLRKTPRCKILQIGIFCQKLINHPYILGHVFVKKAL